MLELNRVSPTRRQRDDDGAVLVTVVIVMLVGFVIASMIAASVMFTIQANAGNKSSTQAFIAAESGRDVARATLDSCGATHFTGANPTYDARVFVATMEGAVPTSADGLTEGCPGADTDYVIIRSTGTGADGSTATIDAVYPWDEIHTDQPGGTMAYFDGKFKTTGSGYNGDLVVRTGNYDCSNDAVIAGDLWVVNGLNKANEGNVTLSSGCVVTGNIYAAGTVKSSSQPVTIGDPVAGTGGDIIALGSVQLSSNGMTVVGDVYSGMNVTLSATGSTPGKIGGDVIAFGAVTGEESASWQITGQVRENQPKPTFDPTLADVFGMTTWADLGPSTSWTSAEFPATTTTTCPSDPDALLSGSGRLIVNLAGCVPNNGKVDITLDGGTITRDVLFLVPATARMNVSITGNITSSGTPAPQLWFVHADSTPSDDAPKCGNGNQNDSFNVTGGRAVNARVLVYSACGLTGTIDSDFAGQIYVDDDARQVNAQFTCTPMSWEPALPNLSCRIRGAGGAAGEPIVTWTLGKLVYQSEVSPAGP